MTARAAGSEIRSALVAGNYIIHVVMPKDDTDTRACNAATAYGYQNISEAHGSVPGGGTGCLYHIVREEDVNVDLGNQFTPAIPPPPASAMTTSSTSRPW